MLYKRLLITALLSVAAVAAGMLGTSMTSFAGVSIGVGITLAPPALPVYAQPLCPGPGYIWTPGYWAWDDDFGYYWVPGTWVLPPAIGLLWTPGYWGWDDGAFVWFAGYWGPVVGFYGGIDYGFGYTGFGYYGGYWRGDTFYYNRTVNNVNVTNITNVYSKTVSNPRPAGPSFNGGSGGTTARPTSAQLAAAGQQRFSLTNSQKQQMQVARADPTQRATVNKGRPAIAATAKPGVFTGSDVIKASRAGATYKAPSVSSSTTSGTNAQTSRTGGVEKRQSFNGSEKRAPLAHSAAPRSEPTLHAYKPTGNVEKHQSFNGSEKRAPLAHNTAPRSEPKQHEYKHNELRPAPERPSTAHQPSVSHIAPQRPSVAHQPSAVPHTSSQRPEMHHPQNGHES